MRPPRIAAAALTALFGPRDTPETANGLADAPVIVHGDPLFDLQDSWWPLDDNQNGRGVLAYSPCPDWSASLRDQSLRATTVPPLAPNTTDWLRIVAAPNAAAHGFSVEVNPPMLDTVAQAIQDVLDSGNTTMVIPDALQVDMKMPVLGDCSLGFANQTVTQVALAPEGISVGIDPDGVFAVQLRVASVSYSAQYSLEQTGTDSPKRESGGLGVTATDVVVSSAFRWKVNEFGGLTPRVARPSSVTLGSFKPHFSQKHALASWLFNLVVRICARQIRDFAAVFIGKIADQLATEALALAMPRAWPLSVGFGNIQEQFLVSAVDFSTAAGSAVISLDMTPAPAPAARHLEPAAPRGAMHWLSRLLFSS